MTAKPFINTAFKFGLPILVVGAAFSGTSAQAAPNYINAACASAVTSPSVFTFGELSAAFLAAPGAPATCLNGDKIYNFLSADPGFFSADRFEIKQNNLIHTLAVTPAPNEVFTPPNPGGLNIGTYRVVYDVLIDTAAYPDLELAAYSTSVAASPILTVPGITAVKTLKETTYTTVCGQVPNAPNLCGTDPAAKFVPGGIKTFSFDSTLVVAGPYSGPGIGATEFDDTIIQRRASVPGPLPIMGALSAFGFARKIRKRYKLA
jgi:hypothetical protein